MLSRPLRYTKNINNNLNKKNLLNISNKNFSSQTDFFNNHFSINKQPNDISSYNDLDFSLSTEIFKSMDIDNVSTAPYLVGRFSRLFAFCEDLNHVKITKNF